MLRTLLLLWAGLLAGIAGPCLAQAPIRIAIILDDIGYNRDRGERALQLPPQVSFAVIPFTPYSRHLAQQGHQQGRDILLHLPLASSDPQRRLDEGGITRGQDEPEIRRRVQAAMRAVPHIVGLNNHMGSQITTDPLIMGWIMDEVRKTPLFFVDSFTNPQSVAQRTALDYRIAALRRDVFLDNSTDPVEIDQAFQRLLNKARQQGHAIAIGHPHHNTLAYLESVLPNLTQQGVELVPVSALVRQLGQPSPRPAARLQALARRILTLPSPTASFLDFTD